MAISIFQQPNQYSMAYSRSPVVYRYAGLNTSYTYIFNFYITTGTTATLTTIYTSTTRNPDTNYGITIDASSLLRNFIKNNNFLYTTENVVFFKAILVEYNGTTATGNSLTSNNASATLGYSDYGNTGTFNITEQTTAVDYAMNSIPTNTPYSLPISTSYTFVWRYNATTTYTIVYKNAAESGNTTIGPTAFAAKTKAGDEARQIACGYADLSNISTRYPITLTIGSNVYIFNPDGCVGNDVQTLKFLNKWGVWDYFFCYGRKDTETTIDYETYKYMKIDYPTMTYNVKDGAYKKSFIQGKGKITLNTGWIDENKNTKLEELFLSEYVLLNSTTPVIITDKTIKYKTDKFDRVINYTIILEEAFDTINNII